MLNFQQNTEIVHLTKFQLVPSSSAEVGFGEASSVKLPLEQCGLQEENTKDWIPTLFGQTNKKNV